MAGVIYTRWLKPRDARAVARLERKAYARDQRNGRRAIAAALHEAEREGTNMCLGLFDGTRLVGFILAYICRDRAAVFEDFEVHHEDAAFLKGESVYVEDVIVLPRYSRSIFLLFKKWARELQRRGPTLPLDAFCEPALLERWTKYSRGFRHKGLELDRTMKVADLTAHQEWYWFSWRQVGERSKAADADKPPGNVMRKPELPADYQARLVRTESDWDRLRDGWDRLVGAMPEASAFLAFDFLRTWWNHFGLSRQLLIVSLYRQGRLVGVAPMMICPKRILGVYRWRLEMIGDAALMERPTLVLDETDPQAEELLWRCVLATEGRWSAVFLREQTAELEDHPFVAALDHRRYRTGQSDIREAPHVTIDRPWDDYFAARSRTLRKSYRRKLRQLEKAGEVRFEGYRHREDVDDALRRYLDVEARSWKAAAQMGVAGKSARLSFYRELVRRLGTSGMHFRFLYLDERPIAATFGVFRAGRFASVEVCHDQAYDRYSPGFVLTGMELRECHETGEYVDYDFLCGTHDNKTPWSKAMYRSRDLYILPNSGWGRTNRFLMFTVKPAAKRLLARLKLDKRAYEWLDRLQLRLR